MKQSQQKINKQAQKKKKQKPQKPERTKQTNFICVVFYYIIIYYICTVADFIQVKQEYCLLLKLLNSVFVERVTVLPV